MASSSSRKSGSSARSKSRRRVVIGASETLRVRYRQDKPEVESQRRQTRTRNPRSADRSGARAGKRLSNVKREERERRQKAVRLRRTLAAVVAVAVVASVAWGLVEISRSSVFTVRTIEVDGMDHHTRESIVEMAGLGGEQKLLYLSPGEAERRLEADPWIAKAQVSRRLPGTVQIGITERVPSAVIDGGGDNLWIVSTDGYWLSQRSAEDTGLVLVRDVTTMTAQAGTLAKEPEVRNAVKVIEALSDDLRRRTAMVSAPTVDETALITNDDVEIFFGEAVDMPEKNRIVSEILEREKGSVVYINVRVINRPTWRGL